MGARSWLAGLIGLALVSSALAIAGETDPTTSTRTEGAAEADEPSDLGTDRRPAPLRAGDPTTTTTAAPAPKPEPRPEVEAASLRTFDHCDAVLDHVRTEGLARVTPWGLPSYGTVGGDFAAPVADGATGTAPESAAGSSATNDGSASYSTTNVQEAGVDEPDLVKNDGTRVLTVFEGRLRLLVRDGAALTLTDQLVLGEAHTAELLLVEDRAIVLAPTGGGTRVIVVDISQPAAMAIVGDRTFEGAYVSSRSAQGSVRLVLSQPGPSLAFTAPRDDSEEARAVALAENRAVIGRSTLDDWLPPGQPCQTVHAPTAFAGYGVTDILTIDPATGDAVDRTSVFAGASEVYATVEHLYVAAPVWSDVTDGAVQSEATHIHRFDISDPRRALYEASGGVPGHLLRPFFMGSGAHLAQWALSEHDGDLRVATTVGEAWDPAGGSASSVTVLRRRGDALVPVGAVTGLGPTEQIYSVRFMGTRGYVVTYRKVDPLYVLDLSDPTAPAVLGELKVPGYSAYLHPIGEHLLLGVGQRDENEDGLAEGTQVSVFDVSDPADPRRTATLQLGERGTISAVEADHRALTWWADPARAILPLSDWETGRFDGAVSLAVHRDAVAEVGRVTHGREGCPLPIVRSRVIDGVVYAFSSAGVTGNDLDGFEPLTATWYPDGASTCRSAA